MKSLKNTTRFSLGVIVGLFLLFFTVNPNKAKANNTSVIGGGISFEVFYQGLAPYGNWINDAKFGFVWSPNVGNDFRPYYSDGYWANTEYGNMWVSNYDWGWAPFHYGRWTMSNRYGWVWVPGYEWGPAWVSWREGGGYYGWAPLQPGVSISVSFGSGYRVPNNYWTFVPYRNLYASNIHSYHVRNRVPALVRNTTIINNTYVDNSVTYVSGPSRSDVTRRTGSTVKRYNVNSTNIRSATRSRVKDNSIAIYRPDSDRRSLNSANRRSAVTSKNNTRSTTNTSARRSANTATNNNSSSVTRRNATSTTSKPAATTNTRRSAANKSRTVKKATTPSNTRATTTTRRAPTSRATTTPKRATTTNSAPTSRARSTSATSRRASTPSPSVRKSTRASNTRATSPSTRSSRSSSTTARRR